jgi:hypothetical protein
MEDLDGIRFWLRMFNLEPYVAVASADITASPEAHRASVPIISEHQAGLLYWYYAIVLFVDTLGLSGGTGVVYYADEAHRTEAEQKRNSFADMIMQGIGKQVAKGKMTGRTLTIPPTKEK